MLIRLVVCLLVLGALAPVPIVRAAPAASGALGLVNAGGDNASGQLGDNTTVDRPLAVATRGEKNAGQLGATSVAAGRAHSLAINGRAGVSAWGENGNGELGNGSVVSSSLPVQVKGVGGTDVLLDVIAVAAGDFHSLALRADGSVMAWGLNTFGQLGDGTTMTRSTPGPVAGLSDVIAIAANGQFNLALRSNGTVVGWGRNTDGQLGDGTTTDRSLFTSVKGPGAGALKDIIAISAGTVHGLAVRADGTVWGWGDNSLNMLGDGTTAQRLTAVQVQAVTPSGSGPLHGIKTVAGGAGHSLALAADGSVWAWGWNQFGQVGDNTTTQRSRAVQVQGAVGSAGPLGNVKAIAAGSQYSVALLADGTVRTWGLNQDGQLADGTTISRHAPVVAKQEINGQSLGLERVHEIAAGDAHTLVVHEGSTARAWGGNEHGQLGNNSAADSPSVVPVLGLGGDGELPHLIAIAAGATHSLALDADGTVWAWGANADGQLGDGTTTERRVPVRVKSPGGGDLLRNIIAISAGGFLVVDEVGSKDQRHSLALRADGTVWAWGGNSAGQLGDGGNVSSSFPVQVKHASGTGFLTAVTDLSAGGVHSLARLATGSAVAWGGNEFGQLGDTSTTPRSLPALVQDGHPRGLRTVKAVAAGSNFSLALQSTGHLAAWGANFSGQLGDNSTTQRLIAVTVTKTPAGPFGSVKAIAAGGEQGLAVRSNGSAWAWGNNSVGQLGDATQVDRHTPTRVVGAKGVGFLDQVVALGSGGLHSTALRADRSVWGWGANNRGQVGAQGGSSTTVPIVVQGLNGFAGQQASVLASGLFHNLIIR